MDLLIRTLARRSRGSITGDMLGLFLALSLSYETGAQWSWGGFCLVTTLAFLLTASFRARFISLRPERLIAPIAAYLRLAIEGGRYLMCLWRRPSTDATLVGPKVMRISYMRYGRRYAIHVPYDESAVSAMTTMQVELHLPDDTGERIIDVTQQPGVPYLCSSGQLGGSKFTVTFGGVRMSGQGVPELPKKKAGPPHGE